MFLQVRITVLDSEGRGIVFIGAPYSFSTVNDVPVDYTINSVLAYDQQTGSTNNITYRIVPDNETCTLRYVTFRYSAFSFHFVIVI